MKRNKFLLLFTAFALLLFTNMNCKKNATEPKVETLPAETQTGARTFGCLVDGKVWVPKSNFPYSSLSTTVQYDILNLTASRTSEHIIFGVYNLNSIGKYDLTLGYNKAQYIINDLIYQCSSGNIEILEFDKTNKIISGRFNFIGKDNDTGKTVTVTNGRFDVTFTN